MVKETMGEVVGMAWVGSMVASDEGLLNMGMDIYMCGGYALAWGHILAQACGFG